MEFGFIKLIRFDSSGNVGIGTNKPQAKLNIHGNVDISGNLLPTQNITHDIGSSTKRWRDIYLSGNTIDLGGTLIQKEESGGIKIADSSGNTLDGTFQNITINGIINQSTQLDVSGSIVPTRDITYDLGSVTKRWRDIYLSGNTIDISGTRISRHTNGNMMVHDVQGNILGVTMDHIDLSGTVIRKHVDGSVVFTDVSSNRVIGRFGDIDVSGNVSATGNITSNNIQCQNLTVSGTTTTINSTTVTVQDPIITLGSNITNTKDKGIEFKYGASKIGFFGYDDSTGNLTFLKDATNTSEVFSGTQGTIEGLTFKSTILNGTAPLTVTSSTLVTNLNADLLEGLNPSQFMRTDISTSTTGTITSSSTITGTRLISNIANGTAPLTVTSSTLVTNLNADLLEGLNPSQFMRTDIDTSTTGNVGIGTLIPTQKLHVVGTVLATTFSGSGALLTALDAGNISAGTLAVARGGTGTTTSTGTGAVVLQASPTINGNLTLGGATGACYIGGGGFDNASLTQYNLKIRSWWGIGFPSYDDVNRITFDTRGGDIINSGDIKSPVLVGQVSYFAMSSAPTGWLKCNGTAISRTTYSALFTAIGTTFGVGDGSTTFVIPDLRGEFIRGWADGHTVDSGRTFGSFQHFAMQDHRHHHGTDGNNNGGYSAGPFGNQSGGGGYNNNTTSTPVGVTNGVGINRADETRPRNRALLACIKF